MSSSYLKIEELEKKFGDFVALKQISLQIEAGEFVCFLGPSGCGKTTLLRTIAGLEQVNRGKIIQQGRSISALPPQQRDFGIVFQSYALFPNLNVADNISYGLVNKGLSRQERQRRVGDLLEQIGLPGIEAKFPGQLSGGQQQRVALARALALEPGLLLLDEPLSALDARVRLHLRQEICELQKKLGVTTIMVTHDQEEALTMADRIVVMNHGTIAQIGTPEEIYQKPNSVFVARFIGSMNFLFADVIDRNTLLVAGSEVGVEYIEHSNAERGTLGFRPENTRLSKIEEADKLPSKGKADCFNLVSDDLVLRGYLDRIIFMGAFIRFTIQVNQSVNVDVDITAAFYKKHNWIIKEELEIRVDKDDLHFYLTQDTPADVSSHCREKSTATVSTAVMTGAQ